MRRTRGVVVALAATGLAFSAGVAVAGPVATPAQLAKHGGATRLDSDQSKNVRKAVDGGRPDDVTDSAASGSGWATCTKTYNGAIWVDVTGKKQVTLLELAKKRGL